MVKLPTRLSQTLLARADACRRSAQLYLEHPGQAAHELWFGSAGHAFAERLIAELIAQNESTLYAAAEGEDPAAAAREVASLSAAMLDEVMAEHPEWAVPIAHPSHSRDHLRECCYHIAVGLDIDPQLVLALEQKFVLDLPNGWTVSGKLDVLSQARPDVLDVTDWKFTFNVPAQAEFMETFQLKLYAVLAMFGHPEDDDGRRLPSVGDGIQYVRGRQGYPRYLDDDGSLRTREVLFSRQELQDWRFDLERLADDVVARFESGEWPAVPGSHCSTCAAPALCPLPAELRRHAGTVNTVDDAREALGSVLRSRAGADAMMREVRAWAKRNGGFVVGDWEFAWRDTSKWETDWPGLEEGVFEAANFGKPFELGQYRKQRTVQSFSKRKLVPEEIAAQVDEEANANGSAAERFGDDAPF